MTFPVMVVEIAFATTPFVTPTWVDVSDYVMSGDVTRGRTSELDKIRAGQCTVILTNEDRRFDPTHATGPYYPNVLPMRRLRIRATYNAVTYDVFSGYIDRWEQQYEHPGNAYAVVTATDAFKVLAAKELPTSAYAYEVATDAPAHWWRLGEPTGSTTAFDSGSSSLLHGHYVGNITSGTGLISRDADAGGQFPGTGTAAYVEIENAGPSGSGAFTVEVILQATAWGGSSKVIWSSNDGSTYLQQGILGGVDFGVDGETLINTVNYPLSQTTHLVCVREADGRLLIYQDGVEKTDIPETVTANLVASALHIGGLPGDTNQTFGGVLDEFAIYDYALSAARIAAHAAEVATPWNGDLSGARVNRILDSIGWPAADRDVDVGNSTLQSAELTGSALAYLQKTEESEGGLVFVAKDGDIRFRSRHNGFNLVSAATFGDGGGAELEYVDIAFDYSEGLIYNEIRVSRSEGVVQTAEDAPSQTAYGERTFTTDGLQIASDSESRDRADFLLAKYKDPVFRTTRMVVQPAGGAEAGLYPQVLGRELGDKVTVRRKPQNVGATIDQAVIVEGIKHNFGDLFWSTEFMLSPATPSPTGAAGAEFLQLNDTDGAGLGFVALAY